MGKLTRFGVSLDEDLLTAFDGLCERKCYGNRSEALRDLIRRALGEEEWRTPEGQAAGTLTLVYDHHKHDLARRLMRLQHEDHDVIVAATHVHLDHDNCLEVLVLRGDAGRVQAMADRLISCRGVRHGVFTPAPLGPELA